MSFNFFNSENYSEKNRLTKSLIRRGRNRVREGERESCINWITNRVSARGTYSNWLAGSKWNVTSILGSGHQGHDSWWWLFCWLWNVVQQLLLCTWLFKSLEYSSTMIHSLWIVLFREGRKIKCSREKGERERERTIPWFMVSRKLVLLSHHPYNSWPVHPLTFLSF